MRLTIKCSIALHCLLFLAEYGEQTKVTSGLLAKSTGCNAAAIRGILGVLQKKELIAIRRCVGGARLLRDPETLTVWEVFHAVEPEGLEDLIGIHPKPSSQCPVGRQIRAVLAGPYQEIADAVRESMERITLRQLLDNYREKIF